MSSGQSESNVDKGKKKFTQNTAQHTKMQRTLLGWYNNWKGVCDRFGHFVKPIFHWGWMPFLIVYLLIAENDIGLTPFDMLPYSDT